MYLHSKRTLVYQIEFQDKINEQVGKELRPKPNNCCNFVAQFYFQRPINVQDGIYVPQDDGVKTTQKKLHNKFFQNPFLGYPWSV